MCERSEKTFEEIPFLFPEKMLMVEYSSPKCGSPLPTPNPNSYYFPSGLPALPSEDTPYSSIPLSQAWLVVGCWAAHISADS